MTRTPEQILEGLHEELALAERKGYQRAAEQIIEEIVLIESLKQQVADKDTVPEGYALVPRELTAENGAKALLIGEFTEPSIHHCTECTDEEFDPGCEQCGGHVIYTEQILVSWTTIKAIHKKMIERFAGRPAQQAMRPDPCEHGISRYTACHFCAQPATEAK